MPGTLYHTQQSRTSYICIQKEKGRAVGTALFSLSYSAFAAHLREALAAVDRTVRLRLEGNLGLAAAGSADSGEILTGTTGGSLAGIAAGLAALGLILEAALCVKFLLTCGEHELLTTFFAN